MPSFVIEPHFRLQEWVAEEKGYFRDGGLDYVFRELVQSTDGKIHDQGDRVGAFQSFERGRAADVSCACHWTVGVAASSGHGKLYPDAYSVAPAGVFVPPDSPVRTPADLVGVPISVGYQSGSHYATIQALAQYMPLRRAQRDVDVRPDRYTHYYAREFPLRYHARMDTRSWGPGERIVFEPYTEEVFDETLRWIAQHRIFAEGGMGSCDYEQAVVARGVQSEV